MPQRRLEAALLFALLQAGEPTLLNGGVPSGFAQPLAVSAASGHGLGLKPRKWNASPVAVPPAPGSRIALASSDRSCAGNGLAHPARRTFLSSAGQVLLPSLLPPALGPAAARAANGMFPNALPDAADYTPKTPGNQPGDLGFAVRKLNKFDSTDGPMLKGCAFGPNCFSTTGDRDDPLIGTLLPYWKVRSGATPAEAVSELEALIRAYPPGQANVDGGGFQIVKVEPAYLYAQFASLKRGYIDDLEFAVASDGLVQVRSSGRNAQKADKGSNAKRLNYLSERLRAKGWNAPEITKDTHEYYFRMNAAKTKTQCLGLNCPDELSLDPE